MMISTLHPFGRHHLAIEFANNLHLGGWGFGYFSVPARAICGARSFRDHLGLLHDERSNGRAVLLYGVWLSDFARPVAQI